MPRVEPELYAFEHENGARKLLESGLALVGMLLVVALVLLMSPGLKMDQIALGNPCGDGHGRLELAGWVCLPSEQGLAYWSRRCDQAGVGCPGGMECRAARTDLLAQGLPGAAEASYCFWSLETLAQRAAPSSPARVQTAHFEPMLIEVAR